MTTPEHTLVGIHCALACGCHQRWGWIAIATAALASNLPDWDGFPMLIDMARFEAGHRVWGHNFISITVLAILLAWTEHRWQWMLGLAQRLKPALPTELQHRDFAASAQTSFIVLFVIAFVAQSIHLPCDMVVSGGNGLSDWLVLPFWPFWNRGFVLPLIPWGDVGPTIIMMLGVIVASRMPARTQRVALATLLSLAGYLLVRGYMRGTLQLLT